MRIQLRQTEIEEALQQYIANQGINLTGKVVEIGFTASRSADGLTADVDITNAPDNTKPTQAIPRAVNTEAQVAEQPTAPAEEVPVAETKENPFAGSDEADAVEEATEATPAVSLFNS